MCAAAPGAEEFAGPRTPGVSGVRSAQLTIRDTVPLDQVAACAGERTGSVVLTARRRPEAE